VHGEESMRKMVTATARPAWRAARAFNNAGVGGARRALHDIDTAQFDALIATNLRGVFVCLKRKRPTNPILSVV
jgi:NAD(P)-dependent dehydrogenase (short-subunit alcohol dehydrogenase family)